MTKERNLSDNLRVQIFFCFFFMTDSIYNSFVILSHFLANFHLKIKIVIQYL